MYLMPLAQHPVRRAFQTKRVRSISWDHEQVIVYANQSFVPPPLPPNFNVARVERGGADFSLLIQDWLATCNTGIGGREGDA